MHNKYQTEMRVSPGWALKCHLSTFGFKTPGSMVDFYYSYYLSQLCSRLNCSHQNNSLFSNGQTCLLLDLSSSWLTWQKKSSLFFWSKRSVGAIKLSDAVLKVWGHSCKIGNMRVPGTSKNQYCQFYKIHHFYLIFTFEYYTVAQKHIRQSYSSVNQHFMAYLWKLMSREHTEKMYSLFGHQKTYLFQR